MLVIKDSPGQLCNRLWAYSKVIATASASKKTLLIPEFYEYSKYFECVNKSEKIIFSTPSDSRIAQLFFWTLKSLLWEGKLTRFLRKVGLVQDIPSQPSEKMGNLNPFVIYLVESWALQVDKSIVVSETPRIHQIFRPKAEYTDEVRRRLDFLRSKSDVLVGVHIRKGDYSQYRGGRYDYDLSEYVKIMKSLRRDCRERVGFFLASNSRLDTSLFSDLLVYQLPDSPAMHDLVGLSMVDYIIGPPSTFSMSASYYGKVPLYFLTQSGASVSLENFSPVIAQNCFENGNVFRHQV